jgi:hypothetical protein
MLTLNGCLLVSVQSAPHKPKKDADTEQARPAEETESLPNCNNDDLYAWTRREMRQLQRDMLDCMEVRR